MRSRGEGTASCPSLSRSVRSAAHRLLARQPTRSRPAPVDKEFVYSTTFPCPAAARRCSNSGRTERRDRRSNPEHARQGYRRLKASITAAASKQVRLATATAISARENRRSRSRRTSDQRLAGNESDTLRDLSSVTAHTSA